MADEIIPPVETLGEVLPNGVSAATGKHQVLVLGIIGGLFVLLIILIRRTAQKPPVIPPVMAVSGNTPEITTPNPLGSPPPNHQPPPVTPPPVHTPPPPVHTPPPPVHTIYRVQEGDTLEEIAARFHTTWEALYSKNQGTIDAWAKAHGHEPPYYNWIFPGETLDI